MIAFQFSTGVGAGGLIFALIRFSPGLPFGLGRVQILHFKSALYLRWQLSLGPLD